MNVPRADVIVSNLVSFASALRRLGVSVPAARVQDAICALEHVPFEDHVGVYWALRCTLTQRQRDIAAFDAAFAAFWDTRQASGQSASERAAIGEIAIRLAGASKPGSDENPDAEEGLGWSASERLRKMDFAAYGPEERRQAMVLMRTIALSLPLRSRRRLRKSTSHNHLDMRRTIRASGRTHGVPIARVWSAAAVGPRKLLLILDVSGSMELYSRTVVMFLLAAVRADHRVEAFAFGTRLTRLTRQLRRRDADAALAEVARAVPDWGGGTRIADTLRTLNDTWGPRGVARGAVVVIVSDGLEHGEPDLLAREISRIHRTAHAVIWVNPLAGDSRYEPLAAGMAAALRHVDVFLPGHNLDALCSLADVLAAVPLRRSQVTRHERRASHTGA